MNVAQETLGFRRAGLSPALSLLMSAFALPIPPAALSSHLHRPTERSPTTTHLIQTSCTPPFPPSRSTRSVKGALWYRPQLKPLNLHNDKIVQLIFAQALGVDKYLESAS